VGQLYEQDLYLWAETTAHLLKQKRFSEIELDALIEELEDVGKSEKRGLKNQLKRIIMHLLKWKYQPERRGKSWKMSIQNGREEIEDAIIDSPSLRKTIPELIASVYPNARENAIAETDLDDWVFPEQNPFTTGQILDRQFFPE
jgi:hypothetical protein